MSCAGTTPGGFGKRELEHDPAFELGLIAVGAGAAAETGALVGVEAGLAEGREGDGELRLDLEILAAELHAGAEHGHALVEVALRESEACGFEQVHQCRGAEDGPIL